MVADMDEIRCPMCGKPNPAELDVCQFCQARLKPLTGPLHDASGGREQDDWLGSLRSEGDLSDAGDADWIDDGEMLSDDDQRDPLDWLSNLDDQAGLERAPSTSLPDRSASPEAGGSDKLSDFPAEESQADQVDLSAWLASLDDEQAEATPGPPAKKISEDEPDWLARFQGTESGPEPEEEDLPDWLKGGEEGVAGGEPGGSQGVDEGLPDWLTDSGSGLGDVGETGEAGRGLQETDEPIAEGDLPEWLTAMDAGSDADRLEAHQTGPADDIGREDEEIPEWLSEIGSDLPDAGKPVEAESGVSEAEEQLEAGELPDWLAAMQAESVEGQSASTDLSEAEEVSSEADAGLEETPEWLSEVEAVLPGKDEPAEETTGAAEPLEAGEMPDWLGEIGPEQGQTWLASPGDEIEAGAAPSAEPDLSEWLQEAEEPELESADLPDWLADVQPAELAEGAGWDVEAEDEGEAEIPDWLAEVESEAPEAEAPQPEPDDFLATGFDDFEFSEAETFDAAVGSVPLEAESVGEEVVDEAEAAEELPDWLDEIAPSDEEMPGGLAGTDLAAPKEASSDWLSELASDVEGGVESRETEADAKLPFVGGADLDQDLESLDLLAEPDWLADVTDEVVAEQRDEAESEIARANLPEWLSAMRPVDSIVTPQTPDEESSMEVESAGPLAGLHDVLPAQQQIFEISRPEPHSLKLNATESQQKHIKMLQRMLQQEEYAPEVTKGISRALPQRLFRWVIALILILTAVFGLVSGTQISELPVANAEILAVSNAIGSLPAQAPVLVAVDYEPGLSGEMDTLAQALLNHLMLRGARLTLISTTPTGPLLGEMLLESLQAQHNYDRGGQFVNLGYVPGGATGLQALADYPMRLSLPYTFSGYEPWEPRLAPLAGVDKISDFAAVLVLSDRQETARAWIEQIGPTLQAPLLLGTSAQIGPLVRPFYGEAPNLVTGYVSGLAGSGAYERLTGVAGRATGSWNVFGLLVLVAAGVILLGGLVNFSLSLNRQKPSSEGEQTNEPA